MQQVKSSLLAQKVKMLINVTVTANQNTFEVYYTAVWTNEISLWAELYIEFWIDMFY